jgi:outer membrane protein
MKQPMRLILLTLLSCSLSAPVSAEETGAAVTQAPSAVAPQVPAARATPVEKPAEAVAVQATTHLGHVDLARIAAESETGKAGQAQFAELKKKLQGQIESKRKQLEKQKAAIEAKFKTLTVEQREARAKEFQKKVEEFQKFGMNAEKELQTKQEDFSEKLYKAIEQASAELGKAKGLALVVVKREMLYLGSGVDAQDVTDDIIRKIDKK